jgi:hypothetical protein
MTKIYEAKYIRGAAMFLLRYLSRLDPSHADTSIPLQNIKKIHVKPTADPDSCIRNTQTLILCVLHAEYFFITGMFLTPQPREILITYWFVSQGVWQNQYL